MTASPRPVIFDPIFVPKPWGGRRLESLLGKRLPPGELIGESWELASLPGCESRVRDGLLAGRTLGELVEAWGTAVCAASELSNGRFPLLTKFLDAHELLSIQVHPRTVPGSPSTAAADVKDEAWYVVHAEPGAELFLGVNPGVSAAELARAAGTPQLPGLLRRWPVKPGECFYLPSGTIHALGAGIVVAEVQRASDVTHRLYDWGRTGLDGRPRELHVEAALQHALVDSAAGARVQAVPRLAHAGLMVDELVRSSRFRLDRVRLAPAANKPLWHTEPAVWMILSGVGNLACEGGSVRFGRGDTLLMPAYGATRTVEVLAECELLEIRTTGDLPAADHVTRARRMA